MNKNDLEALSDTRLNEAKCLLDHGFFHGAYYLCGYAVECALKACIAKSFLQHEFPNKKVVNDSYTHDLSQLLKIANLHQILIADAKMMFRWRLTGRSLKTGASNLDTTIT